MILSKINFRGYDGFIIDERIRQEKRKDNLFYYELRHDDEDWATPCTIENFVWVNFWGTICFKESIDDILCEHIKGRLETELSEEEVSAIWSALGERDNKVLIENI